MLKKLLLMPIILCLLISCVSCSSAESKEITEKLWDKTFKGTVEFDLGEDWEVTWIFDELTVSVEVYTLDNNKIPYSYTKEYEYKVVGNYEKAKIKFPNSHDWNTLILEFDDNGNPYSLFHESNVDDSYFYVKK